MKTLLSLLLLVAAPLLACAQFPYNETCKNASAAGFVISGSARLTAATGTDVAGSGYLRLTDNSLNNVGYAYAQDSFPSNFGITASFEFFSWRVAANSTNQADGMTFFLFDASVNAFRPGGQGGALGYAQYYGAPGLAKGYIGISIDEFGNFSNPTDGAKNGGPGQQRGSVAIRGPGNGKSTTDYVYQTGVIASDAAYNAGFQGFTQRYPDPTNANYRKMKIIMTPGSSAGATIGYKVTVIMYKGGTSLTPVTLINNFDYPFAAPAKLQFGFAASTGSISNFHEIRNITVDATNSSTLLPPVAANDAGLNACQGQQTLIDVTANDYSSNAGGSIHKGTIDLDPATTGIQTSYTDVGKGTYTVDALGIVSFSPVSGFSGVSTASYKVSDTYGVAAATAATITVTVNNSTAPALVINDPAAVCAPATIDIANAAWKSTVSPGASFTYYTGLNDANANTNAMSASATTVSQSGTYYIKESLSGCSTIKPITVQIGSAPTTSFAGADQVYCGSSGSQSATLLATNPDVGAGAWSQVSGPSTATINYPESATSLVSAMAQGVYVFRWTIANTGCASSIDDIQISVGTITSNAGTNQTICNAPGTTLSGSSPAPANGAWTQVSGSSLSFASASSPSTTVTGMVPGNSYVLQWKVTNGGCSSTSTVTIGDLQNTLANAGPDRTVTLSPSFSLAGNTPGSGNTGTWSIIAQPSLSAAVIPSPTNPAATVTSVGVAGDYTFRWTVTNGSCTNFDDVTVRVATALPVRLVSFTATLDNNESAVLKWQTSDEQGNDHFDIQRSEDGLNFSTVGSLAGQGNSAGLHTYISRDNIAGVAGATLYYRLKQVDVDGSFMYSGIVKLHRGNQRETTVLTNPFYTRIVWNEVSDGAEAVAVRLYDSKGMLVASSVKRTEKGSNRLSLDNLSSLPLGMYVLVIEKKSTRQTFELIKK